MNANIVRGESLARHTTFRIGGPAEYFVRVNSRDQLLQAVAWGRARHLEIFILGNGSNLLVSDAGVRGLVIENHASEIAEREILEGDERREKFRVVADSGASLPGLANQLARKGWRGLEWAIGVPATVGAAVVTNAGAHGGAVSDNLVRAEILDVRAVPADESAATQSESDLPPILGQALRRHEILRWWARDELQYAYRTSFLKRHPNEYVVLRAEFDLERDTPAHCIARMNQFTEHRRKTQPTDPSIGSMFKNPPGDYAGRLIETAGLKGTRVGNVQVSQVHANFFVNLGGATASDVMRLVNRVRDAVRAKYEVDLELEIQLMGFPGDDSARIKNG